MIEEEVIDEVIFLMIDRAFIDLIAQGITPTASHAEVIALVSMQKFGSRVSEAAMTWLETARAVESAVRS